MPAGSEFTSLEAGRQFKITQDYVVHCTVPTQRRVLYLGRPLW